MSQLVYAFKSSYMIHLYYIYIYIYIYIYTQEHLNTVFLNVEVVRCALYFLSALDKVTVH